jgi:UDP-3-O-[3-hydroxymyristoyl] glucosamine N-acyltransferase
LAKYFFHRPEPRIHPTAIIDEKANIGRNVYIGPNSIIEDCEIGEGTIIDGNVFIHAGTRIRKRVIIHAGAIIGTTSLAFEKNENGELEWFPQISGVIIEDNVEVGANTTICRGSLSDTFVDKGTKIDIQVVVGHGVRIGKHCVIVAGTVICGSAKIGDQTWIGPHVCIRENITVGNKVIVGAGSVVHKNVPDNLVVTGSPARPTIHVT